MDHRQMHQVLDGDKPFDERTMVDEAETETGEPAKAAH
jgi:aerobic C4-dicarboxylate transport protein